MQRWVVLAALLCVVACGSKQNKLGPKVTDDTDAGAGATASKDGADAGPTLDELRIAAIQKAINETKAQRHACWSKASGDKMIVGTVTLKIKFSKMKVTSVAVANDDTGSEKLGECLIALYKAYGWQPVFTDDAAIQIPVQFLKTKGQYTIHADDVTNRVLSGTDLQVKVLLDESNTGNGAASLSTLTITDQLKIPMHRHTSAELLFFTSGTGTIQGLRSRRRIKAGSAVYIPAGVAHGFTHTSKSPAVAIQLYTAAGPEQRFKGGSKSGTTPVPASEIKRARRNAPRPLVVHIGKLKRYLLGGGKLGNVRLVLDSLKTKAASFQLMLLNAGAAVPKHKHATSTEIILMTSGEGVVTIAGTEYKVRAGHAIQIPAGVEHAFRVTGKGVAAFQFYIGAGPEQRFKKKK